jgi:hypothetical protein
VGELSIKIIFCSPLFFYMLSIIYDPQKDLQNWLRIKEKYPASFEFTKFYPFDKKIKLSKNNIPGLSKTIFPSQIITFNKQAQVIAKTWQKIEDKVIKEITDYLGLPFKKFKLIVHLTTAYLMPYDFQDKWFMIPTHKNIDNQMKCFTHELFHLYDIQKNAPLHYQELEKRVNKFLAVISQKSYFS